MALPLPLPPTDGGTARPLARPMVPTLPLPLPSESPFRARPPFSTISAPGSRPLMASPMVRGADDCWSSSCVVDDSNDCRIRSKCSNSLTLFSCQINNTTMTTYKIEKYSPNTSSKLTLSFHKVFFRHHHRYVVGGSKVIKVVCSSNRSARQCFDLFVHSSSLSSNSLEHCI
jgi:hypothetical protein